MARAVGVDVGGTKILSGLIDQDGTILATDRRPTPKTGDAIVESIVGAVTALCENGDCSMLPVGCGYPGLVSRDGQARYGPNIGLTEYPLRTHLVEALGTAQVVVDNDASAATWAEFRIGAGRDVVDSLVMFTLGTGVGGGLVLDGRLYRGHNGFAGELGHTVIDLDGAWSPSGVDGELEAYASGSAMVRLAAEAHAAGRFRGTPLDGPSAPSGEQVSQSAMAGVVPAVDILAQMGRNLGVSAAGIVNALDPEMIVVGGGASRAGELLLQPARDSLLAHVLGPDHRPVVPIVAAELGSDAGMVGAGLLALDNLESRTTSGGVPTGA